MALRPSGCWFADGPDHVQNETQARPHVRDVAAPYRHPSDQRSRSASCHLSPAETIASQPTQQPPWARRHQPPRREGVQHGVRAPRRAEGRHLGSRAPAFWRQQGLSNRVTQSRPPAFTDVTAKAQARQSFPIRMQSPPQRVGREEGGQRKDRKHDWVVLPRSVACPGAPSRSPIPLPHRRT
jgi:hypothetical protein